MEDIHMKRALAEIQPIQVVSVHSTHLCSLGEGSDLAWSGDRGMVTVGLAFCDNIRNEKSMRFGL